MPDSIKLSELVNEIDEAIKNRFAGQTFWIKADITDVKKQPDKRWCFLKFIEKDSNLITTEIKGVFWLTLIIRLNVLKKKLNKFLRADLK